MIARPKGARRPAACSSDGMQANASSVHKKSFAQVVANPRVERDVPRGRSGNPVPRISFPSQGKVSPLAIRPEPSECGTVWNRLERSGSDAPLSSFPALPLGSRSVEPPARARKVRAPKVVDLSPLSAPVAAPPGCDLSPRGVEDRQRDEMVALSEIFGRDFRLVENQLPMLPEEQVVDGVGSKEHRMLAPSDGSAHAPWPLRYVVRIRPANELNNPGSLSSDDEVWAELEVAYGPWYPFERPSVKLGAVSGVKREEVEEEVGRVVQEVIRSNHKSVDGKAQECIYEMCIKIGEVLRSCQRPCGSSLYVEYQQRQRDEEEARREEQARQRLDEKRKVKEEGERAERELRTAKELAKQMLDLDILETRAYQARVMGPNTAGTLDWLPDNDDDAHETNVCGTASRRIPSGEDTSDEEITFGHESMFKYPGDTEISMRFLEGASSDDDHFPSGGSTRSLDSDGVVFDRSITDEGSPETASCHRGARMRTGSHPSIRSFDAPAGQCFLGKVQSRKSMKTPARVATTAGGRASRSSPSPATDRHGVLVGRSRYKADFEEKCVLGVGGFGRVTKARHLVDKQFYAVKKIELSHDAANEAKILQECTTLPRLTHLHIVRYYQAWIEEEPTPQHSIGGSTVLRRESNDWLSEKVDARGPRARRESGTLRHLYIQMEFCDGTTLREAIDNDTGNLQKDPELIWKLFRQILDGLSYIHAKKMIHRDLKPANIFLDKKNVHAKLGDFGLSTEVLPVDKLHAETDDETPWPRMGRASADRDATCQLSTGVGTALYTAPEVRWRPQGGRRHAYDQRADMYSAGVVFFEMWYGPTATSMERVSILSSLDKAEPAEHVSPRVGKTAAPMRVYPKGFRDRVEPQVITIINSLLNEDPSMRFEATELLHSELLSTSSLDQEMQRLLCSLEHNPHGAESDRVIKSLFGRRETPAKDIMFFERYLQERPFGQVLAKDAAVVKLQEHFRRTGCFLVDVPLLQPALDQSTGLEEHRLVDSANTLLTLRTGLTVPFARTASAWPAGEGRVRAGEVPVFKRFHIGSVFREPIPRMHEQATAPHLEYGHPREISSAIFDFLWCADARARRSRNRFAHDNTFDSLWAVAQESEMLVACAAFFAELVLPSGVRPEIRLSDTRFLPLLLRALGLGSSTPRHDTNMQAMIEISAHARSYAHEHNGKGKAALSSLRSNLAATLERYPFLTGSLRRGTPVKGRSASPLLSRSPDPPRTTPNLEAFVDVAQRLAEAHNACTLEASIQRLDDMLLSAPVSEDRTIAETMLRNLDWLAHRTAGVDRHGSAAGGGAVDDADGRQLVTVSLDPLLKVDQTLYDGTVFVVTFCNSGGPDIICTGGRYDALIDRFSQLHAHGSGGAKSRPCGVSAEFAVDKIAECMLKVGGRDRSSKRERERTDLLALQLSSQVVICHLPSDRGDEAGKTALDVIALASGLRRLGIRCDLRLTQELSPERLLRHCRGTACQFLAVLQRHSDSVTYRVHQMSKGQAEPAQVKEFKDSGDVCDFFASLKAKNRLSATVSPLLAPKRDEVWI